MPYEYHLSLELENLWFLIFKFIPLSDLSFLKLKYNNEVLKIESKKTHPQKCLVNELSKIPNLLMMKTEDFQKSYHFKVKDSFQAKKISFFILINESNANQLELRIMIKKSTEEALYFHQNLIEYLKREVLDKIFSIF